MAKSKLLQIVIGEFEAGGSAWKLLYMDLFKYMWQQGITGATVLRSTEGIGDDDTIRRDFLEDTQFNNLPIMIDVIGNNDVIQKVVAGIKEKMPNGELALLQAYQILEGEIPMENTEYLTLKIYLKEKSNWISTPLYEEVLRILSENNLIWSTVCRGIEGFGKDHIIHKTSFFSLSSQAPIVIESVGKTEVIHQIIPLLKERIKEGMVIAIPCEVIMDK